MQFSLSARALFLLLCFLQITGCGNPGPQGGPRIGTTPVTGTIHVDGIPAAFLRVAAIPANGAGAVPMESAALTTADGKFSLSTYESGDGVPAGEYNLTFAWGEINLMNGQYSGDKLKGKYSDPKKSSVSLSIASGDPARDLGVIELQSR